MANEWQKEIKAIPDLDLKCDYRKMAIQVEVEFGNARAYYQDYIKFMLSYSSKQIQIGDPYYPNVGVCECFMRDWETESITARPKDLFRNDAF